MSSSVEREQTQEMLPPLVGRAFEQDGLLGHLTAAIEGRGSLLLIGGEAGIGKTYLVQDLARQATAAGILVLTGSCYDLSATPPYGPWIDLALRFPHEPGRPSPPVTLVAGEVEGISNQAALFAQVRSFLGSVYPALIVLEDLHWADPGSLELLRFITASIDTQQLCIAVTYRSDELTRQHPLYRQLPSLVHSAGSHRYDLRPLTADDFDDLVGARYPLRPSDQGRLVTYLERFAEGNPFFACELMRTLEEEGRLTCVGDEWLFEPTVEIVVPPLLRQIVDARAARLGEETLRALEVASVIGQDVRIDQWGRLLGIAEDDLMEIVERAVDAHLITINRDGTRIQFVHALTRSAFYEGFSPQRRRAWHRQIGEILSRAANPDLDAVAYHLQQAGDPCAWEWLERAGERAQRAYAWLTAVDRFDAAAASLDGVEGAEEDRSRLLYRSGRLRRYFDPVTGMANLAEAERLARLTGNVVLGADARYSRGLLSCYADEFRLGIEEMAAGIATLESLSPEVARESWVSGPWLADSVPRHARGDEPDIDPAAAVLSAAGIHHRGGSIPWFMAASGRLDDAEAIAERFLATVAGIPAGGLTTSNTGHSLHGLGIAHAARGEPELARRCFAQARAIYETLDHHAVMAFTYLCELREVMLPYFASDLAECRRLAAEAEESIRRAGDAFPVGMSKKIAWVGMLVVDGHWDEAIDIASSVADYGNYCLRQQVTANVAYLAKWRGQAEEAWNVLQDYFPQGSATEPGNRVLHEALQLQRLGAELALDGGDLPGAASWLEANDRWLAWSGATLGRADNRMVWSRYELAAGNLTRSRAYADEAVRFATEPMQPLAIIPAYRAAGIVAHREGRFADAEDHFASALNAADSCDATYGRALTRLALAHLRAETGRTGDAAELLEACRATFVTLRAQPALAEADALIARLSRSSSPLPMGLTAREVEVLRFVAHGLTDAEVAERLSISPRTVGQHLRSVYNKLDVTSRTSAARFAIEHGLD
jgi:DNA-binding CsgD family transcriptional regulator/tetratricopeptide (TPR) repeat protein